MVFKEILPILEINDFLGSPLNVAAKIGERHGTITAAGANRPARGVD